MLVGEALRAAEAWPAVPSLDALPPGPGGFLILAPHPDDESIGCGGLIAESVARGRPVRVVVLSDGAASHPNSASFPPPRLAALRAEETRAAVAELGLDPERALSFLGLPDAALPSRGDAFDAAVAALLREAAAGPPPAAVFTTWGHDPHTDQAAARAIGGAVARALPSQPKLFAYPVWGWTHAHPIPGFPTPPEPVLHEPLRGFRLAVDRHLPAKRRAVAAHRSQTTALIADDPGASGCRPNRSPSPSGPSSCSWRIRPHDRRSPPPRCRASASKHASKQAASSRAGTATAARKPLLSMEISGFKEQHVGAANASAMDAVSVPHRHVPSPEPPVLHGDRATGAAG